MSYIIPNTPIIGSKVFGFIDPKISYNVNWDTTWSFTYALTGSNAAISTFLTTNSSQLSTANNEIISVMFDTTGLSLISSIPSTTLLPIIPNCLTIRDQSHNIIFYNALSTLDTSFILISSIKYYQTLRFRVANGFKNLYIDYKHQLGDYKNLLSLSLTSYNISALSSIYPGFTYMSPLSNNGLSSTLFLNNFHTQGNISPPTYETLEYTPLTYPNYGSGFTTISAITANPI